MNDKPAGWYYVGGGKLRYRDDYGWTDYYLDTADPQAADWPPPAPCGLLRGMPEEESANFAAVRPRRGRRVSTLFHRRRHADSR